MEYNLIAVLLPLSVQLSVTYACGGYHLNPLTCTLLIVVPALEGESFLLRRLQFNPSCCDIVGSRIAVLCSIDI